jgi:BirA family biotin operon repressor/biotin-[acetyl-CoA-carboxylase] ligase
VDTGADELLDLLLPVLESAIDDFLANGVGEQFADWARWSALDDRAVRWDDGRRHGRVLGLSTDGGLRVRTEDGEELVLRSGEVHLWRSRP